MASHTNLYCVCNENKIKVKNGQGIIRVKISKIPSCCNLC